MNIIDRAKLSMARSLLKKASASSALQDPLASFIIRALGLSPKQAVWTPAKYKELTEAGYQNCMIVYACVNQICRNAAGIEWKEMQGDKDARQPKMLPLLERPNPQEGQRRFMSVVFAHMLLSGNAYIIAGRIGTQAPLSLWLARPDRMEVLPGTAPGQLVSGYKYTVSGQSPQPYEEANVLHWKLFHPTNDFYGLSPLEVCRYGIDVINMSSEWNARLLQNDMRPSGALSTDAALNEQQFKLLSKMMRDNWVGHENAGVPLLLAGGLKWANFSMSPKDLDWLNSTKLTKRDICAVFNVDPCLVGDSEYATYSNKQEARKGLHLETILPFMHEFRDELNRWLAPMFGEERWIDIDREKIEVLQEEREKKYAYLSGAAWLTINEKRKATGYAEMGPDGDVILVPISEIPLQQATKEPEQNVDAESGKAALGGASARSTVSGPGFLAKDSRAGVRTPQIAHLIMPHKSFWATDERKSRLWTTFDLRTKARAKSYAPIAQKYLADQKKRIATGIEKVGKYVDLSPESLFNAKDETKTYVTTFGSWYTDHLIRAGNAGIHASKGELFDDAELKRKVDSDKPTSWTFNLSDELAERLRAMIFESGTKVNETTLESIYDAILKGQAENWSVSQLAQYIRESSGGFGFWRANNWARTESTKVDNFGQVEGYKQTEFVEKKAWMCSFLPDSRDSHMAADGQAVGLDEDFDLGGNVRLAYPGDPKGGPADVCNCACSTYPEIGGGD